MDEDDIWQYAATLENVNNPTSTRFREPGRALYKKNYNSGLGRLVAVDIDYGTKIAAVARWWPPVTARGASPLRTISALYVPGQSGWEDNPWPRRPRMKL
jgi:hypothetical protein